MKFRLRTTAAAVGDTNAIRRWIEECGSPETADRFVHRLLIGLQSLETSPRRCRPATESDRFGEAELRQYIFGAYRVLFTIDDKDVVVLHVRHGMRRPAGPEELGQIAGPD